MHNTSLYSVSVQFVFCNCFFLLMLYLTNTLLVWKIKLPLPPSLGAIMYTYYCWGLCGFHTHSLWPTFIHCDCQSLAHIHSLWLSESLTHIHSLWLSVTGSHLFIVIVRVIDPHSFIVTVSHWLTYIHCDCQSLWPTYIHCDCPFWSYKVIIPFGLIGQWSLMVW